MYCIESITILATKVPGGALYGMFKYFGWTGITITIGIVLVAIGLWEDHKDKK